MLANVVVEATQNILAAIDQRHFAAETGEDAGKLDRDIAAALDHNTLGQIGQMECFVRRDDVLKAGDIRPHDAAQAPVAIRMVSARTRAPVARRTVWASSSTARLLTNSTL